MIKWKKCGVELALAVEVGWFTLIIVIYNKSVLLIIEFNVMMRMQNYLAPIPSSPSATIRASNHTGAQVVTVTPVTFYPSEEKS